MAHPVEQFLTSYFTQQEEMGIPSYVVMDKPVQPEITGAFTGELQRRAVEPIVADIRSAETPVPPKPMTMSESLPVQKREEPLIQRETPAPVEPVQPVAVSADIQRETPAVQIPAHSEVQQPVREETPVLKVEKNHEQIRRDLADLYYRSRECSACSLCESRTQVVFGSGNASADIMIVGEAPSFEDDQGGRPFMGQTGQLLTKMLAAINIDREKETFVCNVIKCRPPGNRAPSIQESSICRPILKRQIAIIQPKIILLLGQTAVTAVIDRPENINKLRGTELDYHGIPVVVSYHPTELQRNSALKRPAWEDLQFFQQKYRELINE